MAFVLGVDVSRWQGEMDWAKCAAAGAQYAFIRAGSIDSITGQCYTDYQFDRNADLAPQYMTGVGYYWYLRPNFSIDKQTDYISNLLQPVFSNMDDVMDCEETGSLSTWYVDKNLHLCADQMSDKRGKDPMIYTRKTWWDYSLGVLRPGYPEWAAKLNCWTAQYNEFVTQPMVPLTWSDWKFWQWSADGNMLGHEFGASGSHSIDLNRFNGDLDTFMLYLSGEAPPVDPGEPGEPPGEIFLPYVVNLGPTGAVNIRTGVYPDPAIAAIYGGQVVLASNEPVPGNPNWKKVHVKAFTGYMNGKYLVKL